MLKKKPVSQEFYEKLRKAYFKKKEGENKAPQVVKTIEKAD